MFKVYVSPSSQTANTYASGKTNEAVQCRKIALSLVDALIRCGFNAMTNVASGKTMYDRVRESNVFDSDMHLCIHTNAFNKKLQGTRLFCSSTTGEGYKMCKSIAKHLYPVVPGSSDGIKTDDFYEILNSNAPCAYVEVAFHDNEEQAQWIISHIDDVAEALCRGVCDFYQTEYKSATETVTPDTESHTALYHVQVGAFKERKYADVLAAELRDSGYSAFIARY